MSSGKEFQRTDAAMGNERRPTVDRYATVACSLCMPHVQLDPKHCLCLSAHTHTHTQPFYGPFSGTARVNRCQKRTSGLYGAREDSRRQTHRQSGWAPLHPH